MSILNVENDGTFNMVSVISRVLLHEGPMPLERLLDWIAPKIIAGDQKRAKVSRLRWTQLGLFEEVEGSIRISRELVDLGKSREKAERRLPTIMLQIAFAERNNQNFWDAEKSACADFTRAVAWMLSQEVYCSVFAANHEAEALETSQLGGSDRSLFKNSTRWNGFKDWAPFFGFGSIRRAGKGEFFVIDPTVAIRERLDAVFEKRKELHVSEFVDRLARELPVLDRGTYRREVESQLNPDHWAAPKPNQLSTSLSRALLRLHEDGLIWLDNQSDSKVRLELLGQGRRCVREVTHILRKGTGS